MPSKKGHQPQQSSVGALLNCLSLLGVINASAVQVAMPETVTTPAQVRAHQQASAATCLPLQHQAQQLLQRQGPTPLRRQSEQALRQAET